MIALFDLDENAKIETGIATYRGKADFYEKYPATADHNVGSWAFPASIAERTCP